MDQAIASLRALFHLRTAERKSSAPEQKSSSNGDRTAAIRSALARGPLSPGKLADAVGIDRANLGHLLRALERDGIVVRTGTTANRRVALASAAAKEAL